jgi:SAM-dependent methyltransferase
MASAFIPTNVVTPDLYTDGEYLARNPCWHAEESPWKAEQVLRMLRRHQLTPRTICDVGCGAGEVLRQLQYALPAHCEFWGYDISPQALHLCRPKSNERLHFRFIDAVAEDPAHFDVVLVLDVIEHLEDYFTFLRNLRGKGEYTIFHIPLDLSVQTVLRRNGLLKRRALYGHLHYFTRETALRTLHETHYAVVDHVYTPRSIDLASGVLQRTAKLPRRLGAALAQGLTVRILGGFGLLVLAR